MTEPAAEPKVYVCPTCEKPFDHPGKLMMHRVSAHKYRRGDNANGATPAAKGRTDKPPREPKPAGDGPLPGEAEVVREVKAFTGNMRGAGGIARSFGAVHFGTTLMGVEVDRGTPGAFEEAGKWWVVRSRAVMAEPLLIDQAKRDVRIFRVIRSVNRFLEGGTALEVVGGVVAAAAVDAGVPPGIGIQLGPVPLQPIPMVIDDVLQYVAAERELAGQAPAPTSTSSQPQAEPVVQPATVEGGVEAT